MSPVANERTLSKGAEKALKLFDASFSASRAFRSRVDSRYRAFQSILEPNTDAASWTSKKHPPLANHIIETTLAGLVDDRFAFRVKPKPRFYNDQQEWDSAVKGARAHEILMKFQLNQDGFDRKLRPFALQQSIAEYTVAKTYWRRDTRKKKYLELRPHQDDGGYDIVESERSDTAYAGPCTEVCNVQDWGCHESTFDLERSPVVWHRVWISYEDLLEQQADGLYSNVEQLKDSKEFGADEQPSADGKRRTKDMIEVLEIWYRTGTGIRVVVLGNRAVELRADRANPFWHGRYPFVVSSTQPGLFELGGMPQMEKIQHLQEAHWDLFNQALDGVHLLNNPVFAVNMAVDDPDAYEFFPGAKWPVEGNPDDSVALIQFDSSVTQIAVPWLSMLETQMQNLAGSQPFTSTSEGGNINAQTATEASLVTNLATRSVMAQKAQLYHAYKQIGQQRLELNQQFIRLPIMAEQIGLDNQQELVEIGPLLLQGDYLFDIEPMNESLFRQERKAEAAGVYQMCLQAAPVHAMYSQAGVGHAINLDKAFEEYLKSNDIEDTTGWLVTKPAPAAPQGLPGQPGQGAPPGGQQGPGGVTGQGSIDPAVSPSNQSSISPTVLMQRALAGQGGANGGGGYQGG